MSKDKDNEDDDKEEENFFTSKTKKDNNNINVDNNNIDIEEINNNNIIPLKEEEENNQTAFLSYKDFYNSGYRDPGKEGRKASRIIFLRSFNNWVKASMINKYCKSLGNEISVLDLCCGKGGDLDKYFMNRIKLYVGADISKDSLDNAMQRLEKIKSN